MRGLSPSYQPPGSNQWVYISITLPFPETPKKALSINSLSSTIRLGTPCDFTSFRPSTKVPIKTLITQTNNSNHEALKNWIELFFSSVISPESFSTM